jgi:hypothetical protein
MTNATPMTGTPDPAQPAGEGATVVITHRVRPDRHAEYDAWVADIAPLCRAAPGHLDWHQVRPLAGLSDTYTIIVRFDTLEHLKGWMGSPVRQQFIDRVRPLLVAGDEYAVRSGLDFWFVPPGATTPVPVRWKQFLVTWSAIYPLALLVPLAVLPALHRLGVPAWEPLATLAVTGCVVALMVYVVMPRYTRLLRRWLSA